jgi:hypothetical protein
MEIISMGEPFIVIICSNSAPIGLWPLFINPLIKGSEA